jgi:hypothetical protein
MLDSRIRRPFAVIILTSLWFVSIPEVSAAGYEIIAIENVFSDSPQAMPMYPLAIIITSSRQRFDILPRNTRNTLKQYFVYQTKVRVNGTIFYRLALGNFNTPAMLKRL